MTPLIAIPLTWAAASLGLETLLLVAFLAYVFFLCASKLNIKVLRVSANLIFLAGVALYMYGFSLEETIEGWSTILLRSMLASVEMFVSHHELIEIERAQETPFFLDLFIFVYACAVATSVSTILSLFGKRAMTKVTLNVQRHNGIKYNHVFFGFDENSINLAASMDESKNIAFVEFPSDEEVGKISFGAIVQNVIQGVVDNHGLDSRKVTILKARRKISEVDPSKGILKQLGLSRLEDVCYEKTRFYLLSDNFDRNIKDTLILVKDDFFKQHVIHTNVYKDGLTVQYEQSLFDTHVHFFYRNVMAVLALRDNIENHPIEVLTVAKDKDGKGLGYVEDESLTAMIFAFGASGKEALRYLYSFSSFFRKDGSILPLKCYIQDSQIDLASGSFRATVPYIPHEKNIVYEQSELLTTSFWKGIKERIDETKILFFSTADQKTNLDAASQVLDYAYKFRKGGLKNLKVFVRVEETNDNVKSICDFYNWRAGGKCITVYGDRKEVFSPQWTLSGNSMGFATHSALKASRMYYSFYKAVEMEAPSWKSHNQICDKARQERDYVTLQKQKHIFRQYIHSAYFSEDVAKIAEGREELFRNIPVDVKEYLKWPESDRKIVDIVAHSIQFGVCLGLILDGYDYGTENSEVDKTNHLIKYWKDVPEDEKHLYRLTAKGMFIYLDEDEVIENR